MMNLLKHNSEYPVGMDISDNAIKIVQLDKKKGKIFINALGKFELPKKIFEKGEVLNKEAAIKAVQTAITKPQFGEINLKEAVISLPETKTFVKLVHIEKSINDIEVLIKNKIEKEIPFNLSEIYYDWQEIALTKRHHLILIGAAPRQTTDNYINVFQEANIALAALEIEQIAICRALLKEEIIKQESFPKAIIDIGANRTSFTVYAKNSIIFAISIPISGNEITNQIAESLKITWEKAERVKIVCGLDENKGNGVIKNILTNTITILIEKIKNVISFYNHHFSNYGNIKKIILCGGGANIKNIEKIIFENIKIEVEKGNPFSNIDKELSSKCFEKTGFIPESFVTAIGLALREIISKK